MRVAKEMLHKLNFKYENLEEYLFKNSGIIDLFAAKEIEAIKNFKEDMYIRCGTKTWKPFVYNRGKDKAKMSVPSQKTLDKICEGIQPSVFHSHGVYPSDLSMEDKGGHHELFKYGYQDGIVLGIDGIEIETKHMQLFKVPWSEEFYQKLEDEGVSKIIDNVDQISCMRLASEKNKRECVIQLTDGFGSITNIYDEIIYKTAPEYPYKVLNDKFGLEKYKNIVFDPNRKNRCLVTENKNKRILSCFQVP
jgi:hypothetical protein